MKTVLGLLALFLLPLAFAAPEAPQAVTFLERFGEALLPLVVSAAAAILGYVGLVLKTLIDAQIEKVRVVKVRETLSLVSETAYAKVAEIYQSAVSHLKAASADGQLSASEAEAALHRAVTETWLALPETIRELLTGMAGSSSEAMRRYVQPEVEQGVLRIKKDVAFAEQRSPSEAQLLAARERLSLR
jgi:hypothetical protein